jgi:glycogen operon protein
VLYLNGKILETDSRETRTGVARKTYPRIYAQDNENEINWLDWLGIDSQGRVLRDFARKLIAIRKANPVLSRGRFVWQHRG